MRVTQSMITRNALLRVNQNRDKMNQVQENISSGRKVSRPSDDPTAFSRIKRFEANLEQNDQYLEKIQYADSWITNSISLLEQLSDLVMEAKDLANKGADDQYGAEGRITIAHKLDGILQESLSISNSQYLGKSVFAGTDTKTSNPFLYGSGVVSYIGNNETMSRSYSEGISLDINVSGQQLMDTGLFESLTNLLDGLNNNDSTVIGTELGNLQKASDKVLALTTELGARQKTAALIQTRLEQSSIDLNTFLGEVRDANLDEEIVRYKTEELAYQAALQATSNSLKLNIMQYLA